MVCGGAGGRGLAVRWLDCGRGCGGDGAKCFLRDWRRSTRGWMGMRAGRVFRCVGVQGRNNTRIEWAVGCGI